MTESKGAKYLIAQPLTAYPWPFDAPTKLWHRLWVKSTPELPSDNDNFWRWALSAREMEELKGVPWWVTLNCRADSSALSRRQQRGVDIVRYTRLAIQLVAPVGCNQSTVHHPAMTSTPWGRVESILMAGTVQNFTGRLKNVLGEQTFILPKVEPGGQPELPTRTKPLARRTLRVEASGKVLP